MELGETFSFKGVDLQLGDIVTLKCKNPNRRKVAIPIKGAVIGLNKEGQLLIFNQSQLAFFTSGRFFVPPEDVVSIEVSSPAQEAIPYHTSNQFTHNERVLFRVGEEIVHQGRLIAAFEDRIVVQKDDGKVIDGTAINFSSATTTT